MGWRVGSSQTSEFKIGSSDIGARSENSQHQQFDRLKVSVVETHVSKDFDKLDQLVNANRYFDAIEVAKTMIAVEPSNMQVRFQLADLLDRTSQPRAAIAELLAIRSLSLRSSELAQARQSIDAIVETANQQFKSSNNAMQAKAFFEDLLVLDPSYDRHRWNLLHWLIKEREIDTAQRLFNETGLAGITQAERDLIEQQLTRFGTTLETRREAGVIFADVLATTVHKVVKLNMLLDTGASHTAISLSKLRELGARRTPDIVNVQTANGKVKLPIYELEQLNAGPLTLKNVAVVALTESLPHADGLLGLDVLDQLPTSIVQE